MVETSLTFVYNRDDSTKSQCVKSCKPGSYVNPYNKSAAEPGYFVTRIITRLFRILIGMGSAEHINFERFAWPSIKIARIELKTCRGTLTRQNLTKTHLFPVNSKDSLIYKKNKLSLYQAKQKNLRIYFA